MKLIGDGTIVEFASVVDAVNCALSVQRSGAPAPDHRAAAIVLRIGINLGDVIMEGEDIYGDGVNIAARLEPLAEPGGICISSIVNESIGNRIDVRFQDGGEITVKNIDRPIRIWRWQAGTAAANSRQPNAANLAAKAATASIAVLPFTNMSGDAEQEYFSDGISEDIITDLSKIAGLIVIARNPALPTRDARSTFAPSAASLGCVPCSKARSAGPASACALPRSSSMRKVADISGATATIAI